MEIEKHVSVDESSEIAPELLNRVYAAFLSLPSTEVYFERDEADKDGNRIALANEFLYRFPTGTTTDGFTDQLSGKFILQDRSLIITYAKGINAGRVVLKVNSETGNAELKSFVVFRKNLHEDGEEWFSSVQNAKRPHLHAIESLVKDVESAIENNPEAFKAQEQMGKIGEAPKDTFELKGKQQMARRLALVKKREGEIKKKNGNGRKPSRG